MKKNWLIVGVMLLISSALSSADSTGSDYVLEYDPASPIKDISLKHAQARIAIYYYGIPKGYKEVLTTDEQKFSYHYTESDNSNVTLELVAISGENDKNAHCHGTTSPQNPHVLAVTCKPIGNM